MKKNTSTATKTEWNLTRVCIERKADGVDTFVQSEHSVVRGLVISPETPDSFPYD